MHNQLTGTLPPDLLDGMPQLQRLDVSNGRCLFVGALFLCCHQLCCAGSTDTHLSPCLQLAGNTLSGTLPDTWASSKVRTYNVGL